MRLLAIGAVMTAFAMPAFAEGDIEAGESQFGRQCVSCHLVQNDAGDTLAGRNGRTGPNLYHVPFGPVGSVEDYSYSDAIVQWAEDGGMWDEETFVGFMMNPTNYLRDVTGDARARSKMAYQVRDEQQARDIFAFLVSLNPEAGEDAEAEEAAAE